MEKSDVLGQMEEIQSHTTSSDIQSSDIQSSSSSDIQSSSSSDIHIQRNEILEFNTLERKEGKFQNQVKRQMAVKRAGKKFQNNLLLKKIQSLNRTTATPSVEATATPFEPSEPSANSILIERPEGSQNHIQELGKPMESSQTLLPNDNLQSSQTLLPNDNLQETKQTKPNHQETDCLQLPTNELLYPSLHPTFSSANTINSNSSQSDIMHQEHEGSNDTIMVLRDPILKTDVSFSVPNVKKSKGERKELLALVQAKLAKRKMWIWIGIFELILFIIVVIGLSLGQSKSI